MVLHGFVALAPFEVGEPLFDCLGLVLVETQTVQPRTAAKRNVSSLPSRASRSLAPSACPAVIGCSSRCGRLAVSGTTRGSCRTRLAAARGTCCSRADGTRDMWTRATLCRAGQGAVQPPAGA
jgi:hypothetical protein